MEGLLELVYPDKNQLVADLQDKYARMSFERLAKVDPAEWNIIDKIFDIDTRILMRKQVIKVLSEVLR